MFVFVILSSAAFSGRAQDEPSPEPALTEDTTPFALPTGWVAPSETAAETATDLPTGTSTETATSTLTETPTEAAVTEAPTIEPTAVIASEVPTEAATDVITTALPVPTATSLPEEPPLSPYFVDNFDSGDLSTWTLGAGWALISSEGGQALQVINSGEPTQLQQANLFGTAVQLRFQSATGSLRLSIRQSSVGDYTLVVAPDGTVEAYRLGVLWQTATTSVSQPEQWRTIRLSAINGIVRMTVDGVELLTLVDDAPLPPGSMAIAAVFPALPEEADPSQNTLLVDDVLVSVPTADLPLLPTATATLEEVVPTALPTATETALPSPIQGPLPPEPPLTPIFTDSFDSGPSILWTLGAGWSYVPIGSGLALQGTASNETVTFANDTILDASASVHFQLATGAILLGTRVSESGYYTASFQPNGQVDLYRSGTLLGTANLGPIVPDQWYIMHLSVIGDVIRVIIEGVEVIAVRDAAPLPGGTITLAVSGIDGSKALIDNFSLWVPSTQLKSETSISRGVESLLSVYNLTPVGSPVNNDGSCGAGVGTLDLLNWQGTAGTFRWNAPGDAQWICAGWHINFDHAQQLQTNNEVKVCTRGDLPFREWSGAIRQPATFGPRQSADPPQMEGEWLCITGNLGIINPETLISLGHYYGWNERRLCNGGGNCVGQPEHDYVFDVWLAAVNGTPQPNPLDDPTPTPTPSPTPVPDTDCSDLTLDLIPEHLYPGLSQEALDMRAVATEDGLIVHQGPTLNAVKVGSAILWETAVTVRSRLAFEQANWPDQIWYEVDDGSGGSLGWIVARMEDKYYVAGVDADNDPCEGQVGGPATQMTFNYNRELAATYAIAHSYQNSMVSPGTQRVTKRLVQNQYNSSFIDTIPFANFVYAELGAGTGSAMFVSETIWAAGLPMTDGYVESCTLAPPIWGEAPGRTENEPGSGWRFCWVAAAGAGNTSPAWDLHKSLVEYFTSGTTTIPTYTIFNEVLGNKGEQLSFTGVAKSDRVTDVDIRDFFEGHDVQTGILIAGGDQAISTFARQHLSQLRQGDYLWINSFDESASASDVHGLVIVGWRMPADCQDVINGPMLAPSEFDEEPSIDPEMAVIPYVADFTTAQQPISRPFYCTRFDQSIDPDKDFARHSWFFYTIPDTVEMLLPPVIPGKDIYVDPAWQWEITDGQ